MPDSCDPSSTPSRLALAARRRSSHGLRVMVGLPWEQHIAFLDDRLAADAIVRQIARRCRGLRRAIRRALLCRRQRDSGVDRALARPDARSSASSSRLYEAAKSEDPGALVTYVNFPTTEYLQLPFPRFLLLQRVPRDAGHSSTATWRGSRTSPGEKPAGDGRDRPRQPAQRGDAQAESLEWQIAHGVRARLRRGVRLCLDRRVAPRRPRHRGLGFRPDDTGPREPKPALRAVSDGVLRGSVSPRDRRWPRISVVVCSYNGARTIADTLDRLERSRLSRLTRSSWSTTARPTHTARSRGVQRCG